MNNRLIRIVSGLLAVTLLMGLTACGKKKKKEPKPTTTTTVTTTTTTTAPELPRDPFTGIKDYDTENNRPVAYAVPDESTSIVQVGIEHADMYFEAETEAGIPRMLAIFSSTDKLPDRIGPIRSARPHFIKFVNALDAIYCHIGGSGAARLAIRNQGIADIESAEEIDPILSASDNYSWNRKVFTKEKVQNAIKRMGYRTTTKAKSPFDFGEEVEGTQSAKNLSVKISTRYFVGFTYDEKSGNYKKHKVTTQSYEQALLTPVHETGSGGTVAVANVIVMYDKWSVLDYKNGKAYHIDFELKQGTGLLASGGTAREIVWKRTNDQLSYYEADGKTPLMMAEGKTFICLTDKNHKNKTIVE